MSFKIPSQPEQPFLGPSMTSPLNYDPCITNMLTALIKEARFRNYVKNCTNCDSWSRPKQLCDHWKALPPAEVIVVGCDLHSDDIPF